MPRSSKILSAARASVVLATGAISAAAIAVLPAPTAGAASPAPPSAAARPVPKPGPPPGPGPGPVVARGAAPAAVSPATPNAWSFVGPEPLQQPQNGTTNNRGVTGRVTSLAVEAPKEPLTVFAGSAGAGVWKTTDGGQHWSPTMSDQASLAIGALAVDPNHPQTIYAGTGEINGSDSQFGQGILKSIDAGAHWSAPLGQSTFAGRYIGGLVVDADDSNHVLAATSSGLYQSPDGGNTWSLDTKLAGLMNGLNGRTPSNQVYEIHQDPDQPQTIVASFGDACRTEVGGIATSNDHASTWGTKPTFSSATAGRIGVGLGTGGVGYGAVSVCGTGGMTVLKSVDHSATWPAISPSTPGLFNVFSGDKQAEDPQAQGSYDNAVAVDPANANNAVFGGVSVMTTTTGGASFVDAGHVYTGGFIHPDFHAFAFAQFAKTLYVGNDGGMWSTTDMGGTGMSSDYTDLNSTLQLIQFTAGTELDSQRILGGTQDNGSPGFFNTPGTLLPSMADYSGGDGGVTAIDPTPGSNTIYTEFPNLAIARGNRLVQPPGGAPPVVGPCTSDTDPACAEARAFYAPYVMDQTNPARLLAGAQRVYQTLNGGGANGGAANWSPISPNLTDTEFDPKNGDSLTSIALGPKGGNTIFTTSGEGRVSRTTNGSSWADITGNLPGSTGAQRFPLFEFMRQVAFNPANPAEAWVTMSASNRGRLWHTVDAGAAGGTHWTDISGSGATALPNAPAQTVAEDPVNPAVIYVGTLYGAWVCQTCGGSHPNPQWFRVGTGLPNVQVDSLTFSADQSRLVAWTHGWGQWDTTLPTTGPPGAATAVYASPGDQAATVSWTPPAPNRITKYTVTASPGGAQATVEGTATSATVGGLKEDGTAYTFTVTATNASGTGPASSPSNPVTPPGAPVVTSPQFGVPNQTDVFKVADDGAVTVSWVTGAGAWHGPMAISPPGLTRPGARLAVSRQFGIPNQTDVFVVGNNQAVDVLWVQGIGRWQGPLRISTPGLAPSGAGLAASQQFGIPNQTDVFTVGNDGATRVVWVSGSGAWNGPLAISPSGFSPPGAGLAASPQFGVPNQTDVFKVNNNGALEVVWVQGAGVWKGPLAMTPATVAPPGAAVAASPQFGVANQTDVFAVSLAGSTVVSWVKGAGAWNGPLAIGPPGLAPPGSPVAASPQLGVPNQTDVFQVAGNGATRVLWVQGAGKWNGPLGISPVGFSPAGEALAPSPQFGVPNQTDVFMIRTDGVTHVVWVQGAGKWNGPIPINT